MTMLDRAVEAIAAAKKSGAFVFLIGNGGSYANAMHIAGDLQMVGIRATTLDPANLTRTANDKGYKWVFADWLRLIGKKGDVLIALSGSGRSPNITKAVDVAKRRYMTVIGITGDPRSPLARNAHIVFDRLEDMQATEEGQIAIGHVLMKALRK